MGDLFKESPVLGERDIQSSSPVGGGQRKNILSSPGRGGKKVEMSPGEENREISSFSPRQEGGRNTSSSHHQRRTEKTLHSPVGEDRKGSLPPWGDRAGAVFTLVGG